MPRGPLILLAIALLAAPAATQRPVEDIEEAISRQQDEVDTRLFDELAAHKSEAALAALERALGRQRTQAGVHAALRALRAFAGAGELEADAIELLADQTAKAKGSASRQVAVLTLVEIGDPAREALLEVVERSEDLACQGLACDALVPWLGARNSLAGAELILDHATLEHREGQTYLSIPAADRERYAGLSHRQVVTAVLSARQDPGFTELFAARATARGTPSAWRRVLVDVLAPRAGELVTQALLELCDEGDPEVVFASLEALDSRFDWSDHVRELRRLLKHAGAAVRRGAVLRLGRLGVNDERWRAEALVMARDADHAARMGAAAALADLRTPEAVTALYALLADEAWPVRVEALKAALRLRRADSIPLLIERLELERGRFRDDVHLALRLLTGEDHGRLPGRWKEWWEGERDRFRVPSFDEAAHRENERRRGGDLGYVENSFFGIHVASERVTFVLDVSGSMIERATYQRPRTGTSSRPTALERTRLDVAKEELIEVLKLLPEEVFFNLIFFETAVTAYAGELALLKGPARGDAVRFVEGQWSQGSTNLYDALALAFADPIVDTIYVLSDGHPTHGELTRYEDIRERVRVWNEARHVVVHGVAVGVDSPLLEWLAADTGGEYRRVD